MNNNLSVRSLLIDKTTGKYVKAVDERDLSDFLPLLTQENKSRVIVLDFTPIIKYYHNEIEQKLAQREHKELVVKRATVFNTWTRLKTYTSESLLFQASSQVLNNTEEVLNWIHTRLPALENNFFRANDNINSYKNEKTEALLIFSDDIDVFIEMLLCNIHTTANIDINSIKSDSIITGHCNSIRDRIVNLLARETNYHNRNFRWDSIIKNACMENIGFNPEAILHLLDSEETIQNIKNSILSTATYEDYWDGNHQSRKYSVSWPKANSHSVDRVKILARLLENINSVLCLMEKLKSPDISYNENQESIESDIQRLLSDRNITSKSR